MKNETEKYKLTKFPLEDTPVDDPIYKEPSLIISTSLKSNKKKPDKK